MATEISHDREWAPLWKPARRDKAKPKPISQTGKATTQRAADKRRLMKREPTGHNQLHLCYIGAHWVTHVDLEHVVDASERPDLRDDPRNHKKACSTHNVAKKLGELTETEMVRVERAREEVLNG